MPKTCFTAAEFNTKYFYLKGISTISVALGINENIGIATFGTQTEVVLHMTNEYDKVLEALGKRNRRS